jgi:hypothetical protein
MKKYITALLLLLGLLQNAHATTTFDPNTNILTLDSVVVNGTQFNNVSVLMGTYFVLSVGSSIQRCTSGNLTTAKYNLIVQGMTLAQINQLLGCQYDPALVFRNTGAITYVWHYEDASIGLVQTIYVFFDTNGLRSTAIENGVFKQAVGL